MKSAYRSAPVGRPTGTSVEGFMGPLRTTLIVPAWSQPQIIEAPDPALCREWQACSGFQLSAEKPLGYAQLNEGLRLMATCDLVQILLRASA